MSFRFACSLGHATAMPINFKSALCSFLNPSLYCFARSLARAGPMLCPRTLKCFVLPLILILVLVRFFLFFFSEEL